MLNFVVASNSAIRAQAFSVWYMVLPQNVKLSKFLCGSVEIVNVVSLA